MKASLKFLSRLCITGLLAAAGAAGAQPQFLEEVPFVTSPDNVTLEMLRIANVGPTDHVIDLGSGDGRIVIVAARRFGASGMGVEIIPDLVRRSNASAREAGVAGRVEFREQDLFATDLTRATVVTMYLLPEFNLQLRPRLLALKPGTRLVSHDWDMGDWVPDETTIVQVPDKKVGLEKFSRIHLWVVPARVEGLWCAPDRRLGALVMTQKYQQVAGRWSRGERNVEFTGRLQGNAMKIESRARELAGIEVNGDTLRVPGLPVTFARAQGSTC
ncbi:MAG TPA: methyltransferase domain-containing protein [Ramlibacter sp.]|nr:methyltransferase domain-containing protein [Ramlibacter sp.]